MLWACGREAPLTPTVSLPDGTSSDRPVRPVAGATPVHVAFEEETAAAEVPPRLQVGGEGRLHGGVARKARQVLRGETAAEHSTDDAVAIVDWVEGDLALEAHQIGRGRQELLELGIQDPGVAGEAEEGPVGEVPGEEVQGPADSLPIAGRHCTSDVRPMCTRAETRLTAAVCDWRYTFFGTVSG